MVYFLVVILWSIFGYSLYLSQDTTPHIDILIRLGALQHYYFEPMQLLTAGFLHANLLHIAFNSSALLSLGRLVARFKSPIWMLIIFIVGIIGGGIFSVIFRSGSAGVSVGASAGIMGLCTSLFIWAGKIGYISLMRQLLPTLVLALMPVIPYIDYSGHLGGALVGGIFGLMLNVRYTKKYF